MVITVQIKGEDQRGMTLACFLLEHFDLSLKIIDKTGENLALNINHVARIK